MEIKAVLIVTSGSFILPEGKDGDSSISIQVVPNDDNISEFSETVTLTLNSGTGYILGSFAATLSIRDNEILPNVTFNAPDTSVEEGKFLSFSISLDSPALAGGAEINYSIVGSAINGTDFNTLSGTATIPEGEQEVVVVVDTLEDFIVEGSELFRITLSGGSGFVTPDVSPPDHSLYSG